VENEIPYSKIIAYDEDGCQGEKEAFDGIICVDAMEFIAPEAGVRVHTLDRHR